MDTETRKGIFLNALTGELVERPLTDDEINNLITPDGQETYPEQENK